MPTTVDRGWIGEKKVDLEQIKSDPYILALMKMSDRQIEVMGYTEHGLRHANITSDYAMKICRSLGLNDYETETASIATYLHDIGNLTGRENHGQTGAVLVGQFLLSYGAKPDQLAEILTAISNHDDDPPIIATKTTAICIIADKADVNHTRVRKTANIQTDIHDRVNFAVLDSVIEVSEGFIILNLTLNPSIAQAADYLEIFAGRMQAMRKSAKYLGCEFQLIINGVRII